MELDDYNGNGYYDIRDFIEAPNEKILEFNEGMKFDVCIQNPPYDNGLCNKFLVKSFELAEISVSVMPSAWLLGKKQKTDITKWFDKYGGEIEEINGNDYFDAAIGGTISINYLNQDNDNPKIIFDGKEYEKCSEISRFSNDAFLTEFKKIVEPLYEANNLEENMRAVPDDIHLRKYWIYDQDENDYVIKIAILRGHIAPKYGKKEDFYTLISNNTEEINKAVGQYKDLVKKTNKQGKRLINFYIAFNTKQKMLNALNYLQTDFCRVCLYLKKFNSNMYPNVFDCIPWFDFSNEHFSKSPSEIDDYLFDKFNISDEIRQHIEEILPDYYGIRKG